MNKAITPIIAVVLLLMMTIVAASAAYFWMSSIQISIQEDVQSSLQNSYITDLTSFSIVSTGCEATPDNITIELMNTGSVDIDTGDLVVTLSSSTGSTLDTIIYSDFTGISSDEASSYELTSSYDIISGTSYSIRVAVPGGKTSSDSCTAS